MGNVGGAEILVILVVALLVFGPHKLPEIGRQVGRGMRELRRVQASLRDEVREVLEPIASEGDLSTPRFPPPGRDDTPAGNEEVPGSRPAPGSGERPRDVPEGGVHEPPDSGWGQRPASESGEGTSTSDGIEPPRH